MPKEKHLKKLIRERMQKTGESHTAARRQLLAKAQRSKEPTCPACGSSLAWRVAEEFVPISGEDFFDDMTDGQMADHLMAASTGVWDNWSVARKEPYCPACEPQAALAILGPGHWTADPQIITEALDTLRPGAVITAGMDKGVDPIIAEWCRSTRVPLMRVWEGASVPTWRPRLNEMLSLLVAEARRLECRPDVLVFSTRSAAMGEKAARLCRELGYHVYVVDERGSRQDVLRAPSALKPRARN